MPTDLVMSYSYGLYYFLCDTVEKHAIAFIAFALTKILIALPD